MLHYKYSSFPRASSQQTASHRESSEENPAGFSDQQKACLLFALWIPWMRDPAGSLTDGMTTLGME